LENIAERLDEWQQTGWLVEKSTTNPGRVKRLPWSHMVDRLSYNVLPDAKLLTMPVLMIVGDKDDSTPPEHQQLLYEKLLAKKNTYHQRAPHSFVDPNTGTDTKNLSQTGLMSYRIFNYFISLENESMRFRFLPLV